MAGANIKHAVEVEKCSDNEICGICFTRIHRTDNPRGRLNSCSHLFCVYCIKEWAQSTNICPHCKARFTRIFVIDATGKEQVTKVRKRNYKLWEEEEDSDDDMSALLSLNPVVCSVCALGDNASRMILCDRRQCTYTVHLDCISLTERPAEFFCPDCTRLLSESSTSDECTRFTSSVSDSLQATSTEFTAECGTTENDRQLQNVDCTLSLARRVTPSPQLPTKRPQKISVVPPTWLKDALERNVQPQPNTEGETQRRKRQEPHSDKTQSCLVFDTQKTGPCHNYTLDSIGDNSDLCRSARAAMEQYLQRQDQRSYKRNSNGHRQFGGGLCKVTTTTTPAHCRKRTYSSSFDHNNIDTVGAMGAIENILNPATQRREEEILGQRLALEMLPILRRNWFIRESLLLPSSTGEVAFAPPPTESEVALRERELYSQALTEGRRMARERIQSMVADARLKKERIIRVQALKESAALAKLARIIASHRVNS